MIKSVEPQIQHIRKENADRMLLASFVSRLISSTCHQIRISYSHSLGEDLKTALSVQEAERQERFNESLYTRSKNRYDYCPNRRADVIQETGIEGIRANHEQIGKRAAKAGAHPLVKTGRSSRNIGEREPKLSYALTNVMAEGISRENAQLG